MLSQESLSELQTKFRMGEKVFFIQPDLERLLVDRYLQIHEKLTTPITIELPQGIPEALFSKFLTIISRSYFSKSSFKLYDDVILIKLIQLFDFFGFIEYSLEGWMRLLSGLNSLPEFLVFLTMLKEEESMAKELLEKHYFALGRLFYFKFMGQVTQNRIKNFNKFQKTHSFHFSGDSSLNMKFSDSLWAFFLDKMANTGPSRSWLVNALPFMDLLLSFDGTNPHLITHINEQKAALVSDEVSLKGTVEIKWDVSCQELLKRKSGVSNLFAVEGMKFQLEIFYNFKEEFIYFFAKTIGALENERQIESRMFTVYTRESSADNQQKITAMTLEYGHGHEKISKLLKKTKAPVKKIAHSTARLRVFIKEVKIVTGLREFARKEAEISSEIKPLWNRPGQTNMIPLKLSEKESMEAEIMRRAGFRPLKSQSIFGCVREFYNGTLRIKSEVASQVISAEMRGEDECKLDIPESTTKKSGKHQMEHALFALNRYVMEGIPDFSILGPDLLKLFSIVCNQMLLDKMIKVKSVYEQLALD